MKERNIKRVNGGLWQAVFVWGEWIIYRHGFTFISHFCGADLAQKTQDLWRHQLCHFQIVWRRNPVCLCVCVIEKKKINKYDISHDLVSHHLCRLDSNRLYCACVCTGLTVLAWLTVHKMWKHTLWKLMINFVACTYITYGCHYVSVNASKAELCILMTGLMLQKNAVYATSTIRSFF